MTARLPVINSDSGDWGTVLNEFLQVALNTDGTLKNFIFKRKTADQSVTSSTTLVDDTHIASIAVNAGEAWYLEGVLFCDGVTGGDLKVQITTPGSPTGYWRALGPDAAATSTTAVTVLPTAQLFNVSATVGLLGAGTIVPVGIQGCYIVGTGGTFKIQFAQGTSNGTATILKAGSYLRATKG